MNRTASALFCLCSVGLTIIGIITGAEKILFLAVLIMLWAILFAIWEGQDNDTEASS